MQLPNELQEKIIRYLSYEEISHLRLVCKAFDRICQGLLNKGFTNVDRYHGQCLRNVKTQLPRRESERRNHPLARHCDILNAIETRLSLLSMTFIKYVDMNLCCFIPGKVIDEIYRVLKLVQNTKSPPRAHEILQELRDISSMAMEHFDEKIVPILKQKMLSSQPGHMSPTTSSTLGLQSFIGVSCPNPRDAAFPRGLKSEMAKLQQLQKQNSTTVSMLRKEMTSSKAKVVKFEKKVQDQEKTILELNHIIADQNAKISEQEGRINEVNRKLNEYEQRFTALVTELTSERELEPSGNFEVLRPRTPTCNFPEGNSVNSTNSSLSVRPSSSRKRSPSTAQLCETDPPKTKVRKPLKGKIKSRK